MKETKNKRTITAVSLILSIFTSVAFHIPFFRLVLERIEGGLNGILITGGLAVIMVALNFSFYTFKDKPEEWDMESH